MGPVVEIYQTRVEISNPGLPLIPPERFIDGYRSRNERLAGLMRRLGICEEKSSGWDRGVHTAEVQQVPGPQILRGHERTEVVIHGPK
jgi:predicted HTH transcriptional regulator